MALIPRRLVQLWGFKDDFGVLPKNIAAQRKENMQFLMDLHPGWTFHLLGPDAVLDMIRLYFSSADSEMLHKAFLVKNLFWLQRAHMARFVALYALGGLYVDLDVKINADLTSVLEASLVLTCGNSKSQVDLDIVAARAGDDRILELLRKQAGNILRQQGDGKCSDDSLSSSTGVKLITSWCKTNKLSAKPLADRFILARGGGQCKAVLKTYKKQTWACTIQVRQPFFEVHHGASRRMPGRCLKKTACKPTIKDKSSLGRLKGWNGQKKKNTKSDAVSSASHSALSIPPILNVLQQQYHTLPTQLMLLREAAGSFPEKDFPKLSTMAEVKASKVNKRTKIARILVNKNLSETRRTELIGKITEKKGATVRLVQNALIESKGQMTPALRRFLSVQHRFIRKTKHKK